MVEQDKIKFQKKFGQNFLKDANLLESIVKDAEVDENDEILEIGAGAGALTEKIADKAKNVVSYEIDSNLKQILESKFADRKNVKIIFADALREPITNIENNFQGNYKIVANLPYYITTPLIFKFIEQTKKVLSITVMVQKEVALRLIAKPNSEEYGAITPIIDFYGKATIKRNVSRKMFTPMPNVDSAVVHIKLNREIDRSIEPLFIKVVHSAFAMRRKTFINNLAQSFSISKDTAKKIIQKAGFSESIRGESLSKEDFLLVAQCLGNLLH